MSDERKKELRAQFEDEAIDTFVDIFAEAASGWDTGYTEEELDFLHELCDELALAEENYAIAFGSEELY